MTTKTYANFTAGDYGSIDPSKAPEGSFRGDNVLVYRDGTLGPRPGFKQHSYGRLPAARVNGFTHIEGPNWTLVYVEGTSVYRAQRPDGAAPTDVRLLGTISTDPAGRTVQMYDVGGTDGGGYMHVPEGLTYRMASVGIDPGATMTALTAAPNTMGAGALHGQRLYLIKQIVDSNQVAYSNASDDATWPVSNFFPVGYSDSLVFMESQRGHLTIGTDSGEWYVFSGTPGESGVLRRISGAKLRPNILTPACSVVAGDDVLYYLKPRGSIPATFDGVKVEEIGHQGMARPNVDYGQNIRIGRNQAHDLVKAFMVDPDSPAFYLKAGNGRLLIRNHGAWTRHFTLGVALDRDWAADGRGRIYAFEQWTGVAGQRMFVTDFGLERPGFASDVAARPGDDSDVPVAATVDLPQHWTGDGTELRVRQVVVDIVKWDTGSATANQLDVTVETHGRRGASGFSAETVSKTEAGAGFSTDNIGTPDRWVYDFGTAQPGGGFQVKFPVIRGIGIRAVHVQYDEHKGRPRQ